MSHQKILMQAVSEYAMYSFEDYQKIRDLKLKPYDRFLADGYSEKALWATIKQTVNDAPFFHKGWVSHFRIGSVVAPEKYSNLLYNIWGLSVPETDIREITLGYSSMMFFYNTREEAFAAAILRNYEPIQMAKVKYVSLTEVRKWQNQS